MAKPRNLQVSVENFGPVRDGAFELKPLTILIGANNSGKSYMALLVYAFSQALSGRLHRPSRSSLLESAARKIGESRGELEAWHRSVFPVKKLEQEHVFFRDLPQNIQQILQESFEQSLPALRPDLEEAIRDYFGCEDWHALIRSDISSQTLSIRLNEWNDAPPFLNFQLKPRRKTTALQWAKLDLMTLRVSLSEILEPFPFLALEATKNVQWAFTVMRLQATLWAQLLEANGTFPKGAYYLPSARSGILQGWPVFASMAMRIVRQRPGLERIDVSPFTGVVGDFFQVFGERLLSHPRQRQAPKMQPALDILEGQVFRGEVSVERRGQEPPLMVYKSGSLQLPLQRVSSMIGELTPAISVALSLKIHCQSQSLELG